jgi:DNA-binding response OmpR family regulator
MEILLVEDDASNAKSMIKAIESLGHHVRLAETGKEAVEKVRRNIFDLALLDIMLPDILGFELIPEFKKYDSGIQIITMTGHNSPEMERKIRGYGITYYMTKPVSLYELKSILNHISKKCKKETKI